MNNYSCEAIAEYVSNGAYLVDVRTKNEHRKDALPDSVNIPLNILPVIAAEHFKDEETILVYCYGGGRAIMAEVILKSMGFKNIHNIGGISNYKYCS